MNIGGFFSSILGGENKGNKDKYAMKAPEVDPNAYQYGGAEGGADEAANRYRQTAEQAQNRQGVNVNYGQANIDRRLGYASRASQGSMADLMAQRARGQVPSIAQMQADRQMQQLQANTARQMQQSQAAQAAQAASARGPAGVALAQQNAANNTANMQGQLGSSAAMAASDISNQAQINAANERMQAENAAFGAYSGMRGQDLGSQQQNAAQSQFQAQLSDAQRARNDQMTMGMTGYETGVRNAQLTAQMNQQAQKSGNALGAGQINAGISGQNAAMNNQNGWGAVGLVSTAAGGAASLPGKARGGPVHGRHPYLVGEQGPELIVPKQDGYVIPAGPTATILALGKAGGGPVYKGGACMRAEGGPIQAGGEPPLSTWGGVQASPQDVEDIRLQQAQNANVANQSRLMAQEESPWEATARRYEALRQAAPYLVTDEDREEARRARGVLRGAKTANIAAEEKDSAEEKKAVAEGKALPKQSKMAGLISSLGNFANQQAGKVDVGYHGGYGHSAPQLLPIARAMGGPVMAGGAPTLDMGGSGGMTGGMIKAASTGRMGGGMVGGGGITGGGGVPGGAGSAPGGFGGKLGGMLSSLGGGFQNMAGSIDTSYHPMVSDEDAKQSAYRKGMEFGAAYATKHLTGKEMEPWSDPEEEDAQVEGDKPEPAEIPTAPHPHPLPNPPEIPNEWGSEAGRAAIRTFTKGDNYGRPLAYRPMYTFERDAPGKKAPPPAAQRPSAPAGMSYWDAAKAMVSDEQTKQPAMDLKGGRDPQSFKRDTPSDQKRVGEAYYKGLGKQADDLMAAMQASLGRGASVSKYEGELDDKGFGEVPGQAMADANRSMVGAPYAYKEGLTPGGQAPGETNVGPMAQNMAASPVASTAVKVDPATGLKVIDRDKALKLAMAGIASLQRQEDQTRMSLRSLRRPR